MQFSEFKVAGNVLTIDIRSEINQSRFDAICRDMDRAVAALGRVRLVLVMRHYPSFNSAESLLDDLRFLKLYDDVIDKAAVVADRFWKDTWVGLFGLFSGLPMAFFAMAQVDEAIQWIQHA